MDIYKDQKCLRHPQNRIEYIQIKELTNKEDKLFYCSKCINKDPFFKSIDYVLIEEIIDEGSNSIILKWPPVSDQNIINELSEITFKMKESQPIEEKIYNYFSGLKEEILKKIDIVQKKMIINAKSLPFDYNLIINKYQEISKILELRTLLNDNSSQDKQESYKQFISLMHLQKERNSQELKNLLFSYQEFEKWVNQDQPDQIKQSLLYFINQINFFNEELIPNLTNNSKDKQQIEISNCSPSDKLIELISNKSNFCSNQFITQLKQQLQRVNPILQQMSFDNVHEKNKNPMNFQDLNQEELETVENHIKHLGKLKSNRDYKKEVENSTEIKQMNRILDNKFSFINSSFRQQFEKFMIMTHAFKKQINFNNIITNNNHLACIEKLTNDVFEDVIKLIIHKSNTRIQDNKISIVLTNKLKPIMAQHFLYIRQEEINTILTKYPIFDLIQQPISILPNIELNKGSYANGKQLLSINRKKNNSIEASSASDSSWCNCVSNIILEKDKNYIFRFEIQSTEQNNKFFNIGLMQSHNINSKNGYEDQLSIECKLSKNQITFNDGFINQKIKGSNSFILQSIDNFIELRVNINQQILEILDYPNYTQKYCIANEKKNNLKNHKDLVLYIGVGYQNMKIILQNAFIVDKFEN